MKCSRAASTSGVRTARSLMRRYYHIIETMLIGFDGNEANVKERVGVNQYAFDILWAIYRLREKGEIKHNLIVYLQNLPLTDLPKETNFFKYKVLPGGPLWVFRKLTPHLLFSKNKPDVLFNPTHYLPPILTIPAVLTIHDLFYLENSGQFRKITFWQLKYWTARSVNISKSIIAVSNSTKKEIVRHYPKASKKISVVLHGYDRERFNTAVPNEDVRRIKNKYTIVSDYLLYLGTLKPSKNVERLVEAFVGVKQQKPDIKLVIAGKKGWLFDEIFKKVQKLGLNDEIIFTDFLPEGDKPGLMAGAKVLVAPSLTEGFGMHAIEAMAVGTPVVVSKIDAFEEVVGDAGIFVDPQSIRSITEGINKVLKMSPDEYNRIVKRGLEHAANFSWEKAARETVAVLEAAADRT